jgi:hypothetical protein
VPECQVRDAYVWSGGRAIVATCAAAHMGPMSLVRGNDEGEGRELLPSQITSTYIFPGVGERGQGEAGCVPCGAEGGAEAGAGGCRVCHVMVSSISPPHTHTTAVLLLLQLCVVPSKHAATRVCSS